MANTFSTATLGLGVDTKDFNKSMGETYKSTSSMLANMKLSADAFTDSWNNVTAGLKDTKRIVSGIVISRSFYALLQGLTSASSAALTFSKNMETAAISMEYFVKGTEKAAKAQAFLREMNVFAARTPFSTEEAISLSKYMQAVGVSMNTTKNFLQVITDTAAATGATEENLQRIVFGLGQIMTKGRIANEEIRQLANANIPIYEILQEQLGITGEQISNIGRYWVDADKAIVAILTGLEKRYGGAADRIANTVTGMTDTIKDNAKIIAQISTSGIYDTLAEKMGTIRDMLDTYREVATEQGPAGLFDRLLRDLDDTGELGTLILALIGNTRQLGIALKDLYIAGKPLIDLFGKSLYTSISIAEMTLTGISRVVTGVIKGLEKLGITTGTTAQVISSLFIAYKAAKWMAFLGQGATTAAYSLYQTVTAMSSILPASLKASAGTKLLTASLAGLLTYGLAVYGIFKMINNSMAGLDASTTGENLFPDDYSNAMKEYTAKMEEYNEAIAKYQEDFNAPFETIDDGTNKAVDDFEKITDASKKSAKAVSKHWLATFDEVYSPPKEEGAMTGGFDDLIEDLADLGALLIPPVFEFPKVDDTGLPEYPEFPWSDVYQGSPWETDNEVFKGDWWKQLLPWVALGAAQQLGKILAKNRGADSTGTGTLGKGGGGGGGPVNPFQDPKAAQAALKGMMEKFTSIENNISEELTALKEGKYKTPAEQIAAYKRLQLKVDEAVKLQERISLQAIVAGRTETLKSEKLLEAQRVLLEKNIINNVDAFTKLQREAKELGFSGDKARQELKETRKILEKQYAEYTTLGGATTNIDPLLEGIINTKGLAGKIELINANVGNIRKLLESSGYDALAIQDIIEATITTGKEVTKVLDTIKTSDTTLSENLRLLNSIEDLLNSQLKVKELSVELATIKDIIATRAAQETLNNKVNLSALNDAVDSINTHLEGLHETIAVQKAIIGAGTAEEIAKAKEIQELINANIAFKQVMHTLNTFIDDAIKPLKAIEKYNKRLILQNIDGQRILQNGASYIGAILKKIPEDAADILTPVLTKLDEAYKLAIETGEKPQLTVTDYSKELTEAINKLGEAYRANSETVEEALTKLNTRLSKISGQYPEIEEILNRIATDTAKRAMRTTVPAISEYSRTLLEVYQDKLEELVRIAKSEKEFTSKAAEYLKKIKELADKEDIARYESYLKSVQAEKGTPLPKESFPTNYKQIELSLQEAYREALADLDAKFKAERLPHSQSALLLTEHKELSPAFNQIKALAHELAYYTDSIIGAGIRSSKAYLPEQTGTNFEANVSAGYLNKAVVESGLFKPFATALKSSDLAAMFGQSGYGKTVFSVIAERLNEITRIQAQLPENFDTLRTIVNKIMGQLSVLPTLHTANKMLQKMDLLVATGGTFYDASRQLAAAINGLVFNTKGQFISPLDTVTMANFETKLLPILEKYGTVNEGIYTLNEAGFKALTNVLDDVAWNLAGQAAVMGKQTVYLAALDKKAAGLDQFTFEELNWANIADPKVVKAISQEISSTLATYIADNQAKLAEAVKLIAVQVPQPAIDQAFQSAKQFAATLELIATNAKLGANIKELLTPINVIGEKLGTLSAQRFAGSIYEAPTLGNSVANQLMTELVADLKSSNKNISDAAAARITDIIEKLNRSIYQKGISPYVPRVVEIGETMLGDVARVTLTGEEMLVKVSQLQSLLSNIDTRTAAISTSLNDLINKYNYGAAQGLRMEDLSGFSNAQGEPLTMRNLAYAIINQEKQISDMGNLARQLSDSLGAASSNNPAIPITNYAQFANIGTVLATLSNNLNKQLGQGDNTLKLGGSVYQIKSAEQLAAEFARTNWAGSTEGLFATRHSLFNQSINYGRYAGYASEEAARAGAAPQTTGVYANIGKTTVRLDETQLKNLGTALGIAGIALSIGMMTKDTKNTNDTFKSQVLPLLQESERAAAEQRMKSMGISGWTTGANAGQLAENFLEQYAAMTEEERIFWGQVTAAKADKSFNVFGTSDYATLKNALDDIRNTFEVPLDLTKITREEMTDEELLSKALADGIAKSPLAALTDYIVMSGDTSSTIAKDFYKRYGQYMEAVIRPAYGVDEQWLSAVDLILSSTNKEIQDFISRLGLTGTPASQVPLNLKPVFDSFIQSMQDTAETMILPLIEAQAKYNTLTTSPLTGDYSRVISGIDFSSLSMDAIEQLENVLGITFSNLSESIGLINIDAAEFSDNIMGWVTKLPETISLDGANLSAQDVAILAQAGIQVNGDGTVTFMKAMNENITGTDRYIGLTIEDVSKKVTDTLAKSGLSFDFSEGETTLNLSLDKISKQMRSALFRLNKDLSGQISDDMAEALEGLGVVLDSGYFEITNTAVLNGKMTIEEYLNSMGKSIDRLSPELQAALLAIDDVIRQGGEATRQTVAEWADGISMPSPIDASELTPEIEAAFASIGITFTQSGEEFLMVVNRLGNHIKDGMVLIPAETWDKVNKEVVDALHALGVRTSEEAGFVMVDISGVMESGVGSIIELFANRPDLWNQIPQTVIDQLATAGIAVKNGMLNINVAMLNSLVNLGNEWYGKWSTLPQDVINAMGAAGLQTENGLLKIEQITAETAIPENIDEYIIKPFDELPLELQNRLTGGDKSVAATLKGSEVLITNATEDAFVGAVNAVRTNFENMNEEADSGAKQLADTIAKALTSANRLNNIQIKQSWKPFETATAKAVPRISGTPGNYTVRYGGITYSNIAARSKTEAAKLIEQRTGLDLPGYYYGGIIDKEGVYKAGEFGDQEAIIPLKNKAGLAVIGEVISQNMRAVSPVQTEQLQSARELVNAGIIMQIVSAMIRANQAANMQQTIQPAMTGREKPIVYVQYMIADKQGLRELEQKLSVIRLER